MNGYDTTPPDVPNKEQSNKEKPSKAALIKRFLTPKANGVESNRAVLPAAKKYPAAYTQYAERVGFINHK